MDYRQSVDQISDFQTDDPSVDSGLLIRFGRTRPPTDVDDVEIAHWQQIGDDRDDPRLGAVFGEAVDDEFGRPSAIVWRRNGRRIARTDVHALSLFKFMLIFGHFEKFYFRKWGLLPKRICYARRTKC